MLSGNGGVLLESFESETWTPLNGSDLAMKLYGYNFQSEGMIRFQPITGVQFSDINLDEVGHPPVASGISIPRVPSTTSGFSCSTSG